MQYYRYKYRMFFHFNTPMCEHSHKHHMQAEHICVELRHNNVFFPYQLLKTFDFKYQDIYNKESQLTPLLKQNLTS